MHRDILNAIDHAWNRILPPLLDSAPRLRAFLARRRDSLTLRPPRAWCLAVRASDTRITPLRFPMVPDHPESYDPDRHIIHRVEHEVTLEAAELRWLCRPVAIPRPGVAWTDAADMLGVHPCAIRAAIKRGLFEVRRIARLGGKPGPAIPVVYCPQPLDPASFPLGNMPGPEWGTRWRYLADHIPDSLSQTILRRPVDRPWRSEIVFRGWRWICPRCGGETLRVFYPVAGPPALIPQPLLDAIRALDPEIRPDTPSPRHPDTPLLPGFACAACHNVDEEDRLRSQGWSTLIAHLTGGLLRGRDVAPPAWYTPKRKRAFFHRPHARPSKRQAQVLGFLLNTDLTPSQIANKLGLHPLTIATHISRLLRRHNAPDRHALRQNLLPSPASLKTAG